MFLCDFSENPYQTAIFKEDEVFQMRDPMVKSISVDEYVGMISDVLKMKKNLCICRHFQKLSYMKKSRRVFLKIFFLTVNIFKNLSF